MESFWERFTELSREGLENLDEPIVNEETDSMVKNCPPSKGVRQGLFFFNLSSLK